MKDLLSKRGVKFHSKVEATDILQAMVDRLEAETATSAAMTASLRRRSYGESRDVVIGVAKAQWESDKTVGQLCSLKDFVAGALLETGLAVLTDTEVAALE